MPCPVTGGGDDEETETETSTPTPPDERGIDRRSFMKTALAIGGGGALEAVMQRYGMPTASADNTPIGFEERQNRQHAWGEFLEFDRGTPIPPPHHLLLMVDYLHDGAPSATHRTVVESVFKQLERAFEWSHDGLLFTIGYSPSFFDRYDEPLPEGIDPERGGGLLRPETTIEETSLPREDVTPEPYDAMIHMASDNVPNLLAAEEAMYGRRVRVNGVVFKHHLNGIFSKPKRFPDRRTGFAGRENLDRELEPLDFDEDKIPEEADLSMGFNALRGNSVPRERDATMLEDQQLMEPKPPGQFAQGTIGHLSNLDIDLAAWYDTFDLDERRERMFSPHHSEDTVGVAGEVLGTSNAAEEIPTRDLDFDGDDLAERTTDDATEQDLVGHVQKLGRARFDLQQRLTDDIPADDPATKQRDEEFRGHDGAQELDTPILRRDFDSTDRDRPGMHFVALMRFNGYMNYIRQAMNGTAFDSETFGLDGDDRLQDPELDVDEADNGIVGFLDTKRRGNFLLPPLTLRALPFPQALRIPEMEVDLGEDTVTVTVSRVDDTGQRRRLDPDTVRFGYYRDVNRAGGARPTEITDRTTQVTYEFERDDTGLESGDEKQRFFGKQRGTRRAEIGTNDP